MQSYWSGTTSPTTWWKMTRSTFFVVYILSCARNRNAVRHTSALHTCCCSHSVKKWCVVVSGLAAGVCGVENKEQQKWGSTNIRATAKVPDTPTRLLVVWQSVWCVLCDRPSMIFSADCTCWIGHDQIGRTAFSADGRQSEWCQGL